MTVALPSRSQAASSVPSESGLLHPVVVVPAEEWVFAGAHGPAEPQQNPDTGPQQRRNVTGFLLFFGTF